MVEEPRSSIRGTRASEQSWPSAHRRLEKVKQQVGAEVEFLELHRADHLRHAHVRVCTPRARSLNLSHIAPDCRLWAITMDLFRRECFVRVGEPL
jgi:hypothetical protein